MEKNTRQIEIVLDPIDELDNSMQNKLGSLCPPTGKCCIYKIPKFLRDGNEKCYCPSIISTGPIYHRDKTPELKTMQKVKWTYLQRFLSHSKNTHQQNLLPFLNYVKQHEQEIRAYYEQQIRIASKEFIEMIVLDAAFIIYLFATYPKSYSPIKDSFILENYQNNLSYYVDKDLFLMENQLPFFVLKDMFDIAFGKISPPVSFIAVNLNYMRATYIPGSNAAIVKDKKELSGAKHLLNCLNFNIPAVREPQNEGQQHVFPKPAKQLFAAGVKFKASESKNPLEVKYAEIPSIHVEDIAEHHIF